MHYASRLFTLGLQELLIESGLVFVDLTTRYCLSVSKLVKIQINVCLN